MNIVAIAKAVHSLIIVVVIVIEVVQAKVTIIVLEEAEKDKKLNCVFLKYFTGQVISI